jgi:hypothetical protein
MTSNSVPLPSVLQEFIDFVQWTFAKTMPEWPHEYIVRDQVDENLFMMLVQHIRSQGYESKFYQKSFTYYDYRGMVYWTMSEPLGETTIINRCRKEDSYESRRLKGRLPPSK